MSAGSQANCLTTTTKKAKNTATSGTQMARNAAVLRFVEDSAFDITSVTASKKTSTAIAIAQQALTTLNEAVEGRPIIVALHAPNVSAITLILCLF